MKKTIVLLLFVTCISSVLSAGVVVKGQVVDVETNQGEPFATYQIWKGDKSNKPVVQAITDIDGYFEATLPTGSYTMEIAALGRKTIVLHFILDGKTEIHDFGTIPFEYDTKALAAVTVSASRPLVKMEVDRMTYQVENDVDAKSSTVLDMLRKVPMVTVDGQDQITVNGSSSFKVLVNGKPSITLSSNPSEILKSMPASSVKRVEVITNPGVQYDAEGVGGVLNLVTDNLDTANSDGYNATLRAMATTRGGSVGGYLNVQKRRFSMSANLNTMYNQIKGTVGETMRQQLNPADGSIVGATSQTSTQLLKVPMTTGTLSLGYEIDTLRLVTAAFGLNEIASNVTSDLVTTLTSATSPTLGYTGTSESAWNLNSITGSVDYQRGFASTPGRYVTLSYQYSSSPTNTDTKSLFDAGSTFVAPSRKTDGSVNTVENTLQLDYTTPFTKGSTLNAGIKYINRLNRSDQAYYLDNGSGWQYDEGGSMIYRHNNHIAAGYGEYAMQAGRWGGKAGLRYEHTFQHVSYVLGNGSDFALNYGNLVPAASVQYNLSSASNVGISYNMRISRPGITYLNPYIDTSDPTALTYGNTDLETEKAHTASIVYNYYSPKVMFNLTARYSHLAGAISGYSFYDHQGLLNTTYGNIVTDNTAGLNAFVNWNIGGSTRLMGNGSLSYVHLHSPQLGEQNSGWTGSAYVGLQHTFPWDLKFSSNLMYSARSYTLEGWNDGTTMLMGGITKSFMGDNLTVGLSGITGFGRRGNLTRTNYAAGADFVTRTTTSVPMAQMMFTVSWSFGKNNRQATARKSQHTITNDDLKNQRNTAEEMGDMLNM